MAFSTSFDDFVDFGRLLLNKIPFLNLEIFEIRAKKCKIIFLRIFSYTSLNAKIVIFISVKVESYQK